MTVHAAVWLDHEHAEIFLFDRDTGHDPDFLAPKHISSHTKGHDPHLRGEPREQKVYFEAIARAVEGAEEILVLGPGTAKTQFLKHAQKHEPRLGEKIVGVESADHPTAGQLKAHVREYFRAKDRMLGTAAV